MVADPDSLLIWIRVFYVGVSVGALSFFLLWESGNGVASRSFTTPAQRSRHRLRNLAMLFWVIVLADIIAGHMLFGTAAFLLAPPVALLDGISWPLWLQILIGFLLSDLLEYGLHRLAHRWPWLWRLHSVHHSDPQLDATTALRAHPLETFLYIPPKLALYTLLGLPFWIEGLRAILHNAWLIVQHADVRFPGGMETLRWLLVTPGLHHLHHAQDRLTHDHNFGQIFSFWDRLFGTYLPPEGRPKPLTGLAGYGGEEWQSVYGMMTHPFRKPPDTRVENHLR